MWCDILGRNSVCITLHTNGSFFLIHEYNFKEFFFVLLLSYYANLPLLYPHFKKSKTSHVMTTVKLRTKKNQQKTKMQSFSINWSICIDYFPPPLNFPWWRTFFPHLCFGLNSFSIYLANTSWFSTTVCRKLNLCHLLSKRAITAFTRRTGDLPGTFCSITFLKVCLYNAPYTEKKNHSLNRNFELV